MAKNENKWKIDLGSLQKQLSQQTGSTWSSGDVKAWLSNQGFGPHTTQKEFDTVSAQEAQPQPEPGFIPGLDTAQIGDAATGIANQLLTGGLFKVFGRDSAAPDPPKKKTAPAKPLPTPQEAAASTPESPYQQLAQALAGEYLNQVQQLMPLTSGSAIPGLTAQVTNQAAAAVPGMGGGWLQQQAAAEQKSAQAAGLPQAMSAVGEAQAQGAIPYANAIANTGTANTQYLEAAPWQQILSELASETAYKAASSQGAAAFGATPQNTPAFLQQIFKNLGLAGTAQGPAGGLQAPGTAAKGGAKSTSSATANTPSQTG